MNLKLLLLIGLTILFLRLGHAYLVHPQYNQNDTVRARFSVPLTISKKGDGYYWSKFGLYWKIPKSFEANQWGSVKAIGIVESQLIDNKKYNIVADYSHFEFEESTQPLGKVLPKIRQRLEERILQYLPVNQAGLAIGLLFGGTEQISAQTKQDFRTSGLMHIAAASGYNVSLLAGWISIFTARLFKPKMLALVAILCIGLYVLMAGATASVVRAGIMGAMVIVGKALGRESDALWLLLLTGWVMLMFNPNYLLDIGWQLSFAATFGLVWFHPNQEWQTTLAAQATTLPLLVHHFGSISIISPLANFIVLWVIPIAMQVLALGLVVPPLLLLASPLLNFVLSTTAFMASLPYASVQVPPLNWWWVSGYYLVLWLIVTRIQQWRSGYSKY